MNVVQTKVDMVDPNNSTKFMNVDHPFILINATYEGTIPTWVYDNPLAGGGPLAADSRWGTDNNNERALLKRNRSSTNGLTLLKSSIKCRDHTLNKSKKCKPLQVVGYYGSTKHVSSTLMGSVQTRGDFAYHITFLGVPYRMHMEMIKNAASLFASGGTEIHLSKGRFLEDEEPPVCYLTHNGGDFTFTGIPLPADQLGSCPRGSVPKAGGGEKGAGDRWEGSPGWTQPWMGP